MGNLMIGSVYPPSLGKVDKIYCGSELCWPKQDPIPEDYGFIVTNDFMSKRTDPPKRFESHNNWETYRMFKEMMGNGSLRPMYETSEGVWYRVEMITVWGMYKGLYWEPTSSTGGAFWRHNGIEWLLCVPHTAFTQNGEVVATMKMYFK